ncbi:hypothetical protein TIFTF001_032668 [Ficus carica]|uniref:Translation initiation factor IF-3 n=1 Tax=Ficus carica TaxID=3494 RepID=A0AA88J6R7_FICCA|nr:hypothetical protein TIFTF001_032668 [Ficus carica]
MAAGITTSCSLNPVLPCRKTSPSPLSLSSSSSSDSKLFGFRLRNPNLSSNFNSPLSLSSSLVATPITSRYGGGGSRYSGPGRRRSSQSDSEDEQALDLSTVRSDSVRLIDEQQNMVGIVSKDEAMRRAEDAELDLGMGKVKLEIDYQDNIAFALLTEFRYLANLWFMYILSLTALLTVTLIMFRMVLYSSRMDLKELKMGYNIDQHDYSVRLKSARKFLKDGDKVKVIVNLKGRENEFRNIAIELIKRFQNEIGELATEESKNFRDRNIFIILVPNKAVLQKAQEPPKKKDKSEAVNEVSASI